MVAAVKISLLGSVEIAGGQAQLSARALALLGYLVTHAGAPQPRGHLADLLWPESSTAQARTNLRRELHHLKGAVNGSGALEVSGTALTWRESSGTEVDVLSFHRARTEALLALSQDADDAGTDVRRALASYGGDFLPGCYDDWALRAQEDLQEACLELCDRAVAFHEEHGDLGEAIALQRRRVGLRPLDEPGYRLLMRLQQARGDRAGAMSTYHRCASLLERELGVRPSEQTQKQLDALLREGSVTSSAPASGTNAVPTARGPTQLVGRGPECDRLLEAWSAVREGSRLVLVTGEAGVGKTRLVNELAQLVRHQGGVVATAACFAATASLPLTPVAEWLRHPELRRSAAELDEVWRTEVERLVPQQGSPTDEPDTERARVDAWRRLRFFEGLARSVLTVDQPLLLVVDDLHWCDTATVSWLSFLMSFPTTSPLMVVGTAREEAIHASGALEELGPTGRVTRLPLGPLTLSATAELAEAVAGDSLGEEEVALIHSVTGGNPFYVIEALREAHGTPGPDGPEGLGGVLANRLARLVEPTQQVLQLASAVGRPFSLRLLSEASDQGVDAIVDAVDELWRRRILVQTGDRYAFSHSLLREAAYETVTPARRWLLHRRLAQALELLYSDQLDSVAAELAEQYDRSGQPERALPFYDQAARRATAVFANADAVRLWQRCRELLESMPAGRQRDERELDIIQRLLPPLGAWGGYASKDLEASERRAHELGRRLGRDEIRVTACVALFATTFVQGHTLEANRWAEQAVLMADRFPELAGQAHMAFAGTALSLGQVRAADTHFAQACELAGARDSLPIGTRTEVHARCWWAHALWLLGDETAALAAAAEAERVATSIEHPYSLAVALSYSAITQQVCGDRVSLERVLADLTAVCARYEFAYYRQWAVVLTGWLRGGAEGLTQARAGIAALEAEGSFARMPYWLWLVADLHRAAGDDAAALATLDAADSVATHNADVWWLPEVLRARAALSPTKRAVVDLERAVALAAEQESLALLARCRADLARRTSSDGVPGRPG